MTTLFNCFGLHFPYKELKSITQFSYQTQKYNQISNLQNFCQKKLHTRWRIYLFAIEAYCKSVSHGFFQHRFCGPLCVCTPSFGLHISNVADPNLVWTWRNNIFYKIVVLVVMMAWIRCLVMSATFYLYHKSMSSKEFYKCITARHTPRLFKHIL